MKKKYEIPETGVTRICFESNLLVSGNGQDLSKDSASFISWDDEE